MKSYLSLICLSIFIFSATAFSEVTYQLDKDILYKSGDISEYEKERCRLDFYRPDTKGFATVVWFHGGGLTGGEKKSKKNY
jgi:acetyl esterase/lipase